MKRLAAAGAVLIALSIVLLATARSAKADTVSVSAVDFEFNPSTITIQVGDTVEWNFSGADHTVKSVAGGELASGNKSAGSSYSHTFNAPGTYEYFCEIHGVAQPLSGMAGTVTVAAAPTATTTTGAAASATPSRTPTRTSTVEPTGTTTPVASATPAAGETPSATAIVTAPTANAGAAGAGARPATNILPAAGTGSWSERDPARFGAFVMLAIGATLVAGAAGSLRRRK
ncbi:MAG TPA: plastocyanin/azurin family copper-binding protein [Dehalococcoidia bacterium]